MLINLHEVLQLTVSIHKLQTLSAIRNRRVCVKQAGITCHMPHTRTHPPTHAHTLASHSSERQQQNPIWVCWAPTVCATEAASASTHKITQKQKTKKQKKLNAKAVRLWHLKSSHASVHRMSMFLVSQPGRLSFHATFVSQSQMALIQISQKANNKFKNMS